MGFTGNYVPLKLFARLFLTKYEKQNPKFPPSKNEKLKMARELYREFERGEAERKREIK